MQDPENKNTNSGTSKKLEDVKSYTSVLFGSGAMVGGVAAGDPFLAVSGAVSLFGGFLAPFMAKNRDKYFESLKLDIDNLCSKIDGLTIEKILSNEKVQSTILQVYPTVLRTTENEKLSLMRNIVLNTALQINIEDDLRSMYIQFVSDLTPSHFKILKYFEYPLQWLTDHDVKIEGVTAAGRNTFLHMAIPELYGKDDQFVMDLITRGLLLKGEWLHETVSDFTAPMITDMGKELLRFVETPYQMN